MHYVDLIDRLSKRFYKFSKKRPKLLLDFYLAFILISIYLAINDLSKNKLVAIVFTTIVLLGLSVYLVINGKGYSSEEYVKLEIDLEPVEYSYKTQEELLKKLYSGDKHLYRTTFLKLLRLEKLTEDDYRLPWTRTLRDNKKYNKATLIGFLYLLFENLLPENDNSKVTKLIEEYFIEEIHNGISVSASKFRNTIDPEKEKKSIELNVFMKEIIEIQEKS